MLIDTHVFLGAWPFRSESAPTAAELVTRLKAHGFGLGMVSTLSAVFQPEPMHANRELFAVTRGFRELAPVPILNPSLAAWRDHLDECVGLGPVRAVRILPNYHGYTLRHPRLEKLLAALIEKKLRLMLSVRLEDERNRYFGLKITGTPLDDLDRFLGRHLRLPVVLNGLYQGEIERLAKTRRNFIADFTFAESLHTLESLRAILPASRLMAGTGHPLLSLAAQAAKLHSARLPRRERVAIGSENARRFFQL